MKPTLFRSSIGIVAVLSMAWLCTAFSAVGNTQEPALSGQINLNTAQVDELTLLPGIGVKKAEAIVTARQAKPFEKAEDLLEIKGIGPKMLEKLNPYIKVEGTSDLKTVAASASATSDATSMLQ